MKKLKPIPGRIRCFLDGDDLVDVQKTMDNFFVETKEYLDQKYKEKFPQIEVEVYPLAHESYGSSEIILTNDRLTYLLYNDRLVAGVIEKRTAYNNLEYIFFRNLKNLTFLNPKIPKFKQEI